MKYTGTVNIRDYMVDTICLLSTMFGSSFYRRLQNTEPTLQTPAQSSIHRSGKSLDIILKPSFDTEAPLNHSISYLVIYQTPEPQAALKNTLHRAKISRELITQSVSRFTWLHYMSASHAPNRKEHRFAVEFVVFNAKRKKIQLSSYKSCDFLLLKHAQQQLLEKQR